MILRGTIRNVVDFGAFVDIGVKVDGLLHRSKIRRGLTLTVGDTIEVSSFLLTKNANVSHWT
jgi:protein Tex